MEIGNILYKLRRKRPSFSSVLDWGMRYANSRFVRSGVSLPPLRLFINVNNRCNARCRQCDVGMRDENSMFYRTMIQDGSHELAVEKLEEIFEELKESKPLIAFNGVEPTLYKPLGRAIRSARRLGMKTQITTNGILLPKVAEELFDAGLDFLWLSLDGPPEVHDRVRGIPGAFGKAMEGIRIIDRMKRERGASAPSISVVSTVFHMNQAHVYEFLSLLEKSGVKMDEVLIHHLQYITESLAAAHNGAYPEYPATSISTEGSDPALVDAASLAEEVARVDGGGFSMNVRWKPHLKSVGDMETYYRNPEIFMGNGRCRVFWTEIQILADGSLTGSQRCFPLPELGNIRETPFRELWNGEKMREWRRLLQSKGALPACSRCCSIL